MNSNVGLETRWGELEMEELEEEEEAEVEGWEAQEVMRKWMRMAGRWLHLIIERSPNEGWCLKDVLPIQRHIFTDMYPE